MLQVTFRHLAVDRCDVMISGLDAWLFAGCVGGLTGVIRVDFRQLVTGCCSVQYCRCPVVVDWCNVTVVISGTWQTTVQGLGHRAFSHHAPLTTLAPQRRSWVTGKGPHRHPTCVSTWWRTRNMRIRYETHVCRRVRLTTAQSVLFYDRCYCTQEMRDQCLLCG